MNKGAIFIIGIIVFLVGLVVFTRYNRPSSQIFPSSGIIPLPTGKDCTINKVSKTEATQIMVRAKNALKVDNSSNYVQVSNISQENSEKVGLAFDVIGQNECGAKVFINFLQGKHLQLQGENWERWFWTVNACVNNKRIIIDASTNQQVGTIHTYVICGGII